MTLTNHNYRPDIDGLRSLAVLMVVAFHFFPSFVGGGFIGVDIFFIISGYLISNIIVTHLEAGNFSFTDFYFRRIRRIFPALIIVLIFSLLVGWFFLYCDEYQELARQSIAGIASVANFELLNEIGYFDNAAETKPLLHLWSLGIEEQFYILYPFLLWFCWKKKYSISLVIIFIIAASFFSNVVLVNNNPSWAFYLPFSRFWEIAIGAILSQFSQLNILKNNVKKFLAFIGFGIIILSIIFINKDQKFPGYLAVFPCLGAVFIIAAGKDAWVNRHLLSNRLMVGIGLISYPLYLWHWPLLSFATIIKGRSPRLEVAIGAIFLSFLLAYLTYKFVEQPIRSKIKNKKQLLTIGILSCVILVFSSAIILFKGFDWRISENKNFLIRTTSRGDISDQKCLDIYHDIGNKYCHISGLNQNKKIFIIGDSQAQAIFNGYEQKLVEENYQVIHLAIPGCPFFLDEKNSSGKLTKDEQTVADCNVMFRKVIDAAIKQKPQAILFSNNGWNDKSKEFANSMKETFNLIPNSIPIIYFTQVPKMPFDPINCVRKEDNLKNHCAFSRASYDESAANYSLILNDLKKSYSNLRIINSIDAICDKTQCFASDDFGIFYSDKTHLSKYGALMFARKMPIAYTKLQFY